MENKETFNQIVHEYERYRPTYPGEMFDDILNYAKITNKDNILEIGCGTGQATGGLVNKGFENITCIELGDQLAQFTAEKFQNYNSIRVINSSFEAWDGDGGPYRLAVSGTAFHFIDPEFGYRRVWELLGDDGAMAFFWTVHVPMVDLVHNEIRQHYQELAPHLDDSKHPTPAEIIEERKRITEKSGLFTKINVKQYSRMQTYTSDDFVSLLNTNSRHRQLADPTKNLLLERIRDTINKHGGVIHKDHRVALFLGTKIPSIGD